MDALIQALAALVLMTGFGFAAVLVVLGAFALFNTVVTWITGEEWI